MHTSPSNTNTARLLLAKATWQAEPIVVANRCWCCSYKLSQTIQWLSCKEGTGQHGAMRQFIARWWQAPSTLAQCCCKAWRSPLPALQPLRISVVKALTPWVRRRHAGCSSRGQGCRRRTPSGAAGAWQPPRHLPRGSAWRAGAAPEDHAVALRPSTCLLKRCVTTRHCDEPETGAYAHECTIVSAAHPPTVPTGGWRRLRRSWWRSFCGRQLRLNHRAGA